MRFFCLFIILGCILGLSEVSFSKAPVRSATPSTRSVRRVNPTSYVYGHQLPKVLSNLILEGSASADVAVYVKSMQYGDSLYARNIHRPLTPASTMKILTAEAALIFLGAEYRFSTQLLTNAKTVRNGVLLGDLYVVLAGDPSLTYPDLAELMLALKNKHIQAIAGNVYIDSTAYDQRFYGPGWEWRDKQYYYGAPISASIIDHNYVSFKLAPSKPGKTAQVVSSAKSFVPNVKNSVVTKASRSRCSVRLSNSSNNMISIDGCIGRYASSGVGYVVTDIPEYNRTLFKSLMTRLGINVYGTVTFKSAPNSLSMINTHASQPLRVLIKEMLKKSDNVIAGALFKKIGQLYTRKPGSWENGSLAVSQILSSHAGMSISGLRLLDGSGLSPDNLTTPAQLMSVLEYAYHSNINNDFISALPIAGVDGTLKHRMWNIPRKVRAKTGTISGVVSLAGYVMTADKEPLAFVIMINGTKGFGWRYKALEDKIATTLTRYTRI